MCKNIEIVNEVSLEVPLIKEFEELLNLCIAERVWEKTSKELAYMFRVDPTAIVAGLTQYNIYMKDIGYIEFTPSNYFTTSTYKANELIRENIRQFSNAKTFYVADSVRDHLKKMDPLKKGDIQEVIKEVKEYFHLHFNEYTTVEKQLIENKLQVAKQYTEWWADDSIDMLEYVTKKDSSVRRSHAQLQGIVAPKGSSIWAKYTPPLEWNCRCVLMPTNKAKTKQNMNSKEINESSVFDEIRYSTAHLLNDASLKTQRQSVIHHTHPYFERYLTYNRI
jgi:SPP1 gp7 family putative phage head morphogenesis protein